MTALLLGVIYLPLGMVWAYGLALLALPLALEGFWLLHSADRREGGTGVAPTKGQLRLRAMVRGLLFAGLTASAVSLLLTR